MKIEKILVPVDFSKDSEQALHVAIELAGQFEAVLILLHGAETEFPAYMAKIKSEADAQISGRRQLVKDAGMRAGAIVELGIPGPKIVEVATDEDVDLIVMGTHGHTGLHHLLIGSITERVVRQAPCPVLTLPKLGLAE